MMIYFEIKKRVVYMGLQREFIESFSIANIKDFLDELDRLKSHSPDDIVSIIIRNKEKRP